MIFPLACYPAETDQRSGISCSTQQNQDSGASLSCPMNVVSVPYSFLINSTSPDLDSLTLHPSGPTASRTVSNFQSVSTPTKTPMLLHPLFCGRKESHGSPFLQIGLGFLTTSREF